MSNKDDNWVIYVVLPVPILGTYYTMYPIFWQIQNRGSRVIYQRPLVMFWQGRWQGRNWSISGTAWSSGVCKIWITVTSCCYCGMKNTPALYILFFKLLSLTLLGNNDILNLMKLFFQKSVERWQTTFFESEHFTEKIPLYLAGVVFTFS